MIFLNPDMLFSSGKRLKYLQGSPEQREGRAADRRRGAKSATWLKAGNRQKKENVY